MIHLLLWDNGASFEVVLEDISVYFEANVIFTIDYGSSFVTLYKHGCTTCGILKCHDYECQTDALSPVQRDLSFTDTFGQRDFIDSSMQFAASVLDTSINDVAKEEVCETCSYLSHETVAHAQQVEPINVDGGVLQETTEYGLYGKERHINDESREDY